MKFKTIVLLAIFVFASQSISPIDLTFQNQATDVFSEKTDSIFRDLSLTEKQSKQIRDSIQKEIYQAKRDQIQYNKNALVLIKAAHKRRAQFKTEILTYLNEDQKRNFKKIFSLNRLETELFNLKAGLILDLLQTNTVEYILLQIQEEYKGQISTFAIGGGTRKKACCGGHTSLPFLATSYQRPLLALALYDVILPDANSFLQKKWGKDDFLTRLKKAESCLPDLLCLRFLSANPDLNVSKQVNHQELLEQAKKVSDLPFIVTGCGDSAIDEEFIPILSQTMKGENALVGIATEDNYRMVTASCLANGHSLIVETPDDLNIAKQQNILITDLGLPRERIVMHHVTAALGYGLEYTYSIMEKCRLAALEGDHMLSSVMLNFIGQETWKTKEAQEDEELGINWEVMTAIAYLEAGADILVLDHPESAIRLSKILDDFSS